MGVELFELQRINCMHDRRMQAGENRNEDGDASEGEDSTD